MFLASGELGENSSQLTASPTYFSSSYIYCSDCRAYISTYPVEWLFQDLVSHRDIRMIVPVYHMYHDIVQVSDNWVWVKIPLTSYVPAYVSAESCWMKRERRGNKPCSRCKSQLLSVYALYSTTTSTTAVVLTIYINIILLAIRRCVVFYIKNE